MIAIALVLFASMAPSYGYDGMDVWSRMSWSRQNNEVVSGGGGGVDTNIVLWSRMDSPTNCCGGWNAPDSSQYAAAGGQTNVAARPLQIALLTGATNGFRFDGSSDYIDYGNFPVPPPTGFSFCVWIKSTANTYLNVGGSYHYAGMNEAGFYLRSQAAGGSWAAGSYGVRLVTDAGGAKVLHTGAVALDDGNWHHIAFTQSADGTDHSLYIDGGTTYYTNDANTFVMQYANNQRMSLGALPDDSGTPSWFGFWPGDMDEGMIYDRPLTTNEVYTIYTNAPSSVRGP